MKISKIISSILATLIITMGIYSCNKAADAYKVGDHVAAKWSDGKYWTATITGIDGSKYNVAYDDGTAGSVTKDGLKPIAAQADLKVGDAVWAVWSGNSKMYEGTIQELQSGGAIIKWNDGSMPSLANYGKIAK